MSKIKGKNFIASVLIDTAYLPIFCAKSIDLTTDQDEIEVTSINSGVDREYVPGMASSMLTCSGLTDLNNNDARVSAIYLMQQAVRRTIHDIQIVFTADDAELQVLNFKAFLKSNSISRETSSYTNATVTMRITGGVSYSNVIPDPTDPICDIADPLYLDMAEGESSIADALLTQTGLEILGVWRSGTRYTPTNGTPGSLEFFFDIATGTVSFDATNPANPPSEPVHVLYKVTA